MRLCGTIVFLLSITRFNSGIITVCPFLKPLGCKKYDVNFINPSFQWPPQFEIQVYSAELQNIVIVQPSQQLFDSIGSSLKFLILRRCILSSFYLPTGLEHLEITGTEIEEFLLPEKSEIQLKSLEVRNCSFGWLPNVLTQMNRLGKLIIADSEEDEVSLNDFSMLQAETLDLKGCNMDVTSIENLQLTTICINKFKLTMPEFGGWTVPKLEHLDLSYNQITELPKKLPVINNVQHLHMNFNKITVVNMSEFETFVALKTLSLESNSLSNITIEKKMELPVIEVLSLSYNYISDLKFLDQIHMPNLRFLGLNGNGIVSLQSVMPHLRASYHVAFQISVQGNPLDCYWVQEEINRLEDSIIFQGYNLYMEVCGVTISISF
ncbi:leucine-rich repeat and death domain-containing protein 1-like [Uranotaenia lowii]|uniref:leucine-rich repeat and death domain-containing protein 1-like n=1 Tax=Uranotaenia lowii TaxID=190385 RepID=UPI00247B25FB|nr:leucine-rich repeat and death domain-containing protein 1-like [Uranotaenia lowii]